VSRLLEVEALEVSFGAASAVRGASLALDRGETLCLVGESGCGKSVTALAVMGLLARNASRRAARLSFDGQDLRGLDERGMSRLRGNRMAMIFQEPMTSLNPAYTVGSQMAEVMLRHRGGTRAAAMARAEDLLGRVRITSPAMRLGQYPHQLSGGLRQRVMIAMALIASPRLLFADEPTTALDVTVQAQILELFRELCARRGLAIVLVTHSLGVVARVADRVQVMYAGQALERGSAEEVLAAPAHPYTRALLRSVPDARVQGDAHSEPAAGAPARLATIPGQPPDLAHAIRGCAFAPRCERASELCRREAPRFAPNPRAACHHPEEGA